MGIRDEQNIIDEARSSLPTNANVVVGPGDDCAVLDLGTGTLTLLAVDQVVADVHYLAEGTTPDEAAVKLLNRNLSDVAAMGGTPTHSLVAIASNLIDQDWHLRFLRALGAEAGKWNVSVCGGDLSGVSKGDSVAALTIVGEVEPDKLCLRSDAKDGDDIFMTGRCGGSFASGRHLGFAPRVREGRFLAGAFTRAMIDVSDGVLIDLNRLCRASQLTAVIDLGALPLNDGVEIVQGLTDGEDYELLFAVSPERKSDLVRSWPFDDVPLTEIGRFIQGDSPEAVDLDGTSLRSKLNLKTGGHDHFES